MRHPRILTRFTALSQAFFLSVLSLLATCEQYHFGATDWALMDVENDEALRAACKNDACGFVRKANLLALRWQISPAI